MNYLGRTIRFRLLISFALANTYLLALAAFGESIPQLLFLVVVVGSSFQLVDQLFAKLLELVFGWRNELTK